MARRGSSGISSGRGGKSPITNRGGMKKASRKSVSLMTPVVAADAPAGDEPQTEPEPTGSTGSTGGSGDGGSNVVLNPGI